MSPEQRAASENRRPLLRGKLLATSTALILLSRVLWAADPVFDASGFTKNRDFFGQLPFEHIDPMTGNLLLTFTDLVLPGNAGFDLAIQRTYNSKAVFANYPQTALGEDSWAGVGWTLHLGRVINSTPPIIEMPDGSRRAAFSKQSPGGYPGTHITRDYWIYDTSGPNPVLKLPNGLKYTFGPVVLGTGVPSRYATEIRDTYNNVVSIAYDIAEPRDRIVSIQQQLATGETRTITFTTGGTSKSLQTMTYLNRVWTYAQVDTSPISAQHSLLTEVRPPTSPSNGAAWHYAYSDTGPVRNELIEMTTPNGGTITYTYKDEDFNFGAGYPVQTRSVGTRETGGRDVPNGTWTYDYAVGTPANKTVITSPSNCGKMTYTFDGIGLSGTPIWRIGLLTEKKTETDGGTLRQKETLTWIPSEHISDEFETVGPFTEQFIKVPLLETRNIERPAAPNTYETTNFYQTANLNDFGRPWKTEEDGELLRTTERTFQYNFTPYIVDRLASERVDVGSETFQRTYTYNLANGFKETETGFALFPGSAGLLTDYIPGSAGNVGGIKNGNNHTTSFTYHWGRVKTITRAMDTPGIPSIERVINPDGTILWEKRRPSEGGGFTTFFTYDTLSRLLERDPPAGTTTVTAYDNAGGAFTTTTRGSSIVKTFLDGYGRTSGTSNNVGVLADTDYDVCGRRSYEGYPFSGGNLADPDGTPGSPNIGTQLGYDELDRIQTRTNPDSTTVSYDYSDGVDVDITDENSHLTHQEWSAFGTPSDARLMEVTDAASKTTTYSYNALGSLTKVSPPNAAPDRDWSYNSRNLLEDETHPESGTVHYTYDNAGNLETRTDPAFGQTTYFYDANERLTDIDAPPPPPGTPSYDVDLGYDEADNRTSLSNGSVASTFKFDGADRLQERTDVVNGRSFTQLFAWNGNDSIEKVTYATQPPRHVQYLYDNGQRITSIGTTSQPTLYAGGFSYHPSGPPEEYDWGTGLSKTTDYSYYSQRYFLHTIDVSNGILNLNYSDYDNVGNIQDLLDARPGMNQAFIYDNRDRLTHATGPYNQSGSQTFVVNDLGDRTSMNINGQAVVYAYEGSTNRLEHSSNPSIDYTYDDNGNLTGVTAPTATTYGYTAFNMMEYSTPSGGAMTVYRYDGDNQRTQRTTGSETHYFLHGIGGQLLSEFRECGGQVLSVRDYVYAGSRLLASLEPATATLTVSPGSPVGEGAGTATVLVTLTTADGQPVPPGPAVTANFATANGTATAGADYTGTSGQVQFNPGEPSGSTRPINVEILQDLLDETNETFTVTLSNPSCNATIEAGVHIVTITDDDPTPTLSVGDCTVNPEGGTGATNPCVFTVSLSAVSGLDVTVAYTTADGTATQGADYTGQTGTLTFPAGTPSKTVSVVVLGDALDEANETFFLNLSNPTNATILDGQGVGTIMDDDPPPVVSVGDCSVGEGNGGTTPCVFLVSLSVASGQTVSVSYATSNGTATAPADYQARSNTLIFNAGVTSQPVSVNVVGDLIDEANETFFLNLSNPVNVTIGDGQGQATILDDDTATLSINDCSVTEGDTGSVPCTFTVSLSFESSFTVSAAYATTNGTATAGPDYTGISGTVTFPPGTTSQPLTVSVLGDMSDEYDETFFLNLSNPVNTTIVDGQGMGTILDNDPEPTITITDDSVTESDCYDGSINFTISITPPSGKIVSVHYSTVAGTATEGIDYFPASGTVNIPPGFSSTPVSIVVFPDFVPEGNETFTVSLSDPVNGVIVDGEGVGTIMDNDTTASTAMELIHGSEEWQNLGPGPAGAGTDFFLLAQKPHSSYEVVVDGTTGDIGTAPTGVLLQRVMCTIPSGVIQNSNPVGAGYSRSLRWQNISPEPVLDELIRVQSSDCSSNCNRDDVYRIRVYETTYSIARFNTANQVTVLLIRNHGVEAVSGYITFWNPVGTLLAQHQFNLLPNQLLILDSASVPGVAGQSGSITVTHTGRYGDLVGKAEAFVPSTGDTFATPMLPRER